MYSSNRLAKRSLDVMRDTESLSIPCLASFPLQADAEAAGLQALIDELHGRVAAMQVRAD